MAMNSLAESQLFYEYRENPFGKIWKAIWKIMPSFAARHSPFFFFNDGGVLWNQGFGQVAFLKDGRSLIIRWSFGASRQRVIYLSKIHRWDPPHEQEPLT